MAMPVKSQRCQPSCPARKLNAAPVLYASTRLKKLVTGTSWPSRNMETTHALFARATNIGPAASPSQRHQFGDVGCAPIVVVVLGMLARLALAEQVRDA